jgi:hypothetical protein
MRLEELDRERSANGVNMSGSYSPGVQLVV